MRTTSLRTRRGNRSSVTIQGVIALAALSLLGQTAQLTPWLHSPNGSNGFGPRYAVIDLGTNVAPMKITDSGYVLLSGTAGYVRWYNGTSMVLGPTSQTPDFSQYTNGSVTTVADMREDGTAVGNMEYYATHATDDSGSEGTIYYQEAIWGPGSSAPAVSSAITPDVYMGRLDGLLFGTDDRIVGISGTAKWSVRSLNQLLQTAGGYHWSDTFREGAELGNVDFSNLNDTHDRGYITNTPVVYFYAVNQDDQALLELHSFDVSLYPAPGTERYDHFVLATSGIGGPTMNFAPYGLSNHDTNSPAHPTYVVGQSLPGASPNYGYWYNGTDHTMTNFYATAINAAVSTTNNGASYQPAPQMVGNGYVNGSWVPALMEMNPTNGVFGVPQALDQLVSTNSGWSGISVGGSSINDSGAIVGTATYTGTATTIGPHGVMLVPAKFALRDESNINKGWDPDMDTDQIPWTIVAKAAVNGNFNDNELTKIVFPSDQLASMFELAVADDSTTYIEINPSSPGQPIELTQKETNISIMGKNANPNTINNASIELRLKNDPSHRAVAKMMVKAVPDLAPLKLKFYAVQDSRFLLGPDEAMYGFSSYGTQIRSPLGSMGGMYSEIQSRFSQCAMNFQLISAAEYRDVPYLKNPVGIAPSGQTISNLDDDDVDWISSHFQRSDFSDGDIACILVHQTDQGTLGIYIPPSHLMFLPIDAWYPIYNKGDPPHIVPPGTNDAGTQSYIWAEGGGPDLFESEDSNGAVKSPYRVFAHESGHYLKISTRQDDGFGSPIGGHDTGTYPPDTVALMQEGKPGKWMRHEDWNQAVLSANRLHQGLNP